MTPFAVLTAVAAGIVAGLTSHALTAAHRRFPCWFPPVIGVSAAIAGTVGAGAAGADLGNVGHMLAAQLFFAGIGMMALAARGANPRRRDAAGRRTP